ncbi:MAG: GDP-mannose 4,6-dehydratase [Candidatus Paceibacterota bacterium]
MKPKTTPKKVKKVVKIKHKTPRKTVKKPVNEPVKNNPYKNKNILITGGLGFIGSNLAIDLVKLGANVTIVDAMIPEYGGNLHNIEPIKEKVNVQFCDIMDKNAMEWLVRGQDYIFHLAGQVSHVMSFTNPYLDIDYNVTGTVVLSEACRKYNPKAIIIFTGTRSQYGSVKTLPATEDAPTDPKGVYEITNLTAEKILIAYNNNHGVRSVLTRLTNIYGPRAQMKTDKYGVANWFIRLAIDDATIPIFGDGKIMRDFLYVDDVVEALLALPLHEECYGQIYNVGHHEVSNFGELAHATIDIAGTGRAKFTPFSEERKKQEPGHFYSDITKIHKAIGWKPRILLREGIQRTVDFYKKHKKHYW